jgi:tRNA threonylcarbamoyladenosine biosynthesis protein TsaB
MRVIPLWDLLFSENPSPSCHVIHVSIVRMKILAIDTATERCSVALRVEGRSVERAVHTARGHGDLVLTMVDEVLKETGLGLRELDGIAYGRGPGAFTGVRIAIGVVQGLAFGAQLPTVGISDLAAVAQQVARPDSRILVCMDARMSEVYWGLFAQAEEDVLSAASEERVSGPDKVAAQNPTILAGTGFRAYPELRQRFAELPAHDELLPHARDIALLGERELRAGRGVPAAEAQPVYLRNQVTFG